MYRLALIWLLSASAWAGTAQLSWTAPTLNTDGSALTDLTGYGVYRRCGTSALTQIATLPLSPLAWTDTVADGQTCYWSLTAIASSGISVRSNEVSKAFVVGAPGSVAATFVWQARSPSVALSRTDHGPYVSAYVHGTGSYTTAAFTPQATSLLVAAININHYASAVDASPTFTISDSQGLTWTRRVEAITTIWWSGALFVYTAPSAAASSTTITVDDGAHDVAQYRVEVFSYTGEDASPIGSSATDNLMSLDGAESITLGAAPATSSDVLAFLSRQLADATLSVTHGTGWTEIYDSSSNYNALQAQVRTGSTSTTVDWDDVSPGGSLWKAFGCAIEIKASAAAAALPVHPTIVSQSVSRASIH